MENVRKAAPILCGVLKGMLFIGFSIQIVLGICWLGCNFLQVQSFGEPESALYRGVLALFGANPAILYALQLAAAFSAGFFFLQNLRPSKIGFALWRALALVTIPFGLQCHLALLPYSFMSSAFILFLLFLLKIRRKGAVRPLLAALACAAALAGLSGAADPDKWEMPGHSIEGALASRFAWPTLWKDFGRYGEEAQIVPYEVAWNSTFHSGDMRLFQESLESQAGVEAARKCYLQMAEVAWDYHASMIIRQIGWDVLGYAVTPVIFPLQMAGEAYDSYTGRNYEVMRENAPVLTRHYVDYGCWWFVWMLVLSFILAFCRALCRRDKRSCGEGRKCRRKTMITAGVCCLASGVLTAVLTMRGAGRMDYRETIAVYELWLAVPLFLMGGGRLGETAVPGEITGRKGT